MLTLKDQRVLVLGLGASGLAMARWCAGLGATVTVADTRAAPPQLETLKQELPAISLVHGALNAALLRQLQPSLLLKSPGLSPGALAELSTAANSMGLRIGGELSLFAQALGELRRERNYSPKLLAVTGTNGKTTVTALTGKLIERSGRSVALAGNIGPTLLDTLAQALAADRLPEVWVLELSSFQLDEHSLAAGLFQATAAAILNITPDHLDWHASMSAYVAAKARILDERTLAILNRDDATVMALLQATAAPARGPKAAQPGQRPWGGFGAEAPQRPGDYGIEVVNGMAWLVRARPADGTARRRGARGKPEAEELFVQRLMPADALRLRGRHNAVNALAALALAESAGCSLATMLHGLREYRGEPHRVESVAVLNQVEYFDDSKGTNVGATVAALNGLGPERKLVLILGGDGKGQDFTPLADPVARFVRAVVLLGRDAPNIRAVLQDSGVPLLDAVSMPEAVHMARRQARPGDAVLLSPACASFDMFDNYSHRARVFCDAVRELAGAAGVVLESST